MRGVLKLGGSCTLWVKPYLAHLALQASEPPISPQAHSLASLPFSILQQPGEPLSKSQPEHFSAPSKQQLGEPLI